MSLFSVIGKVIGAGAKAGLIRGTVGKIFGGGRPVQQSLPIPRATSTAVLGRVASKGLPAIRRTIPGVVGGLAAGAALDRLTGQPERKKRRRINPCNDKALRRALRRIEMYDKQRKRVDQALRKACPPSRRRAPSRKC